MNQSIKIKLKSPRLLSQRMRKRLKEIGDYVINSPMSQLIQTTKLIRLKITKLIYDIFSCRSRIEDFFICAQNIILDLFCLLDKPYSCQCPLPPWLLSEYLERKRNQNVFFISDEQSDSSGAQTSSIGIDIVNKSLSVTSSAAIFYNSSFVFIFSFHYFIFISKVHSQANVVIFFSRKLGNSPFRGNAP